MRDFILGVLNGIGALALVMVLTFIGINAFGGSLVYNPALLALVLIAAMWVTYCGAYLKFNR